ncbi:MAG: Na/Pi cotransporter family protein [SAR324 cluster bacterium]
MATLVGLAGGVALLLWGLHQVETGIGNAYGAELRRLVGRGMRHPLLAWLTGLGVTGLLQSSTATALIAVSFAREGLMQTAPALAVMLGADVGTALVVQVFAFDLSWLSPLFILIGTAGAFMRRSSRQEGSFRALIGLGLMLLALHLMITVAQPLLRGEAFQEILDAIADQPVPLLILGALVTWLAHSSVAAVLLVVSLASVNIVTLPMGLALVLGANLGGTIPQFITTLGSRPEVRRIPLGNLLRKAAGVTIALLLLPYLVRLTQHLPVPPGHQIALFHLGFNLALSALFIGFTQPAANLLARLMPDAPAALNDGEPRYLDRSALGTPAVALTYAERETLRMGDVVEQMLRGFIEVLRDNDEIKLQKIRQLDDIVDRLHREIKLYLTSMGAQPASEKEQRRTAAVLSFTINLEHIGDIVDNNLLDLAAKKLRQKIAFSPEGFAEIAAMHKALLANLRLAFGVFMSDDVPLARQLLQQKAQFRDLELRAAESHLERLRGQRVESIESSSLHLDVLNEMKRINSHITSVCYPILEEAGELTESRLKTPA